MLSQKIENIALSGTMEISAKMIEMKRSGIDIYDLCVGEPDLPTPDHIKEAAQLAIDQNKTKYTINSGIRELREAVSNKFLNEYGAKFEIEQIIISNGAKQSVYNALMAIINDGDEVLLPLPYYVSYPAMIKLAGGKPKYIATKTENSYKLTVQELSSSITDKTKGLILCNPNNPTGAVYKKKELEGIVEYAVKKDIIIITDEIYEKLIYDEEIFTSISSIGEQYKENLVVINGVSKAYSMTGWRIGYALGPKKIVSLMNKLQSHSTSNACTISQYAALAALTGPQDIVEKQRVIFEERRNLVRDKLKSIDSLEFIEPQGAFYFFVNIKQIIEKLDNIGSSKEFCLMLLNEAHVASVPGSVFGMEGYLRISYAKSKDELNTAMNKIREILTVLV